MSGVSYQELNRYRMTAWEWIKSNSSRLSDWHQKIWHLAEPAWREYESADWYVDRLRKEGFEVEAGSGGMPTAFSARWSNGEGPQLGTYAEYDAVPNNCQAAGTEEKPREGFSRFAPGHTDPHSALGIGTLAAVLAAKHAMQEHDIKGTIRYFGEPAEKVQGSKVVHGLKGYYDGLDAMVSFHPCYMMPLCNTTRWDTHCGAYYSLIYTFLCDRPESWLSTASDSAIPAAHSAARAPGANAALVTMYNLTKISTESMLPHSGAWSLNEAILSAGNATADNLPARVAQIQYTWRVPDVQMAERILKVLDANAAHAAAVMQCEVKTRWVARNRPGLANHTLAEATYRNLELAGPPQYSAKAIAAARELQANVGTRPMERPFLEACESLITPQEAERILRMQLPSWQKNWTSDDYVEMTWYAPTVRLYIARPILKAAPDLSGYPGWVMNALGGIRECIDPTFITAGRTVAATLLELACNPGLLEHAKEEHERRQEEAGRVAPLLPKDFTAPVEYPWPEYVYRDGRREWGLADLAFE